jgi:hypothetical protein
LFPALHELTKATQFIDQFGEHGGSSFSNGPPLQPDAEVSNGSYLTPMPTPTDYRYEGFASIIPNYEEEGLK